MPTYGTNKARLGKITRKRKSLVEDKQRKRKRSVVGANKIQRKRNRVSSRAKRHYSSK